MSSTGTPRLGEIVRNKASWPEIPLHESDWLVTIDRNTREEILRVASRLARDPKPVEQLQPDHFEMPLCRQLATRLRDILAKGARFTLIDRLPMEELSDRQATKIYWLLSSMITPPVAQKLDGSMIFEVKDTGKQATPGSGVRPAETNAEQSIHNDNAFNKAAPDVVGLLCVRPALEGGASRVMSFYTAHNELMRCHPDILDRLYEPFPHDRQREHLPDEEGIFWAPIFSYKNSELLARFSPHPIRNAYQLLGEKIDDRTEHALSTIRTVCNESDIAVSFTMERGQIQFVNNRQIGHSRTGFRDYDDAAKKRLMVRLWLRQSGGRDYQGTGSTLSQ
jgi:Taurine catabolism dioxygenase TauD, TfdA family